MKTRIVGLIMLLACMFALAPVASWAQQQKLEQKKQQEKVPVIIMNPRTGETTRKDVPTGPDFEDNLRQAFGIPTKAEEARLAQFIEETKLPKKAECVYIKHARTRGYFDPKLVAWNGVGYHAGIFPVIQRVPDGVVKTIWRNDRTPAGKYAVVYFKADRLATNWRDTDEGKHSGSYDVKPVVPALCPVPKDAKRKEVKEPKK